MPFQLQVVQVNRTGTGLKSMGGQNSSLIGGEMPDIISDRRWVQSARSWRA